MDDKWKKFKVYMSKQHVDIDPLPKGRQYLPEFIVLENEYGRLFHRNEGEVDVILVNPNWDRDSQIAQIIPANAEIVRCASMPQNQIYITKKKRLKWLVF